MGFFVIIEIYASGHKQAQDMHWLFLYGGLCLLYTLRETFCLSPLCWQILVCVDSYFFKTCFVLKARYLKTLWFLVSRSFSLLPSCSYSSYLLNTSPTSNLCQYIFLISSFCNVLQGILLWISSLKCLNMFVIIVSF